MPDENEITREVMVGSTVWPARGDALREIGHASRTVRDASWSGSTLWLTVAVGAQHFMYRRDDFDLEPPKEPLTVGTLLEPEQTPREAILEEAARTIMGDRKRTYGDAQESFGRIAALWSAILGHPVSATEVALCMTALKISRAVGAPDHRDSYVDMAGYAALAFELDPPLPDARS